MFRLLKEVLTTPERPLAVNTSPQQPQTFPTRRPIPPSSNQAGQEFSKSLEEDGPVLSDEDMLVEDTLEDLGRRSTDTTEDLELAAKILSKLCNLLDAKTPARSGLFRASDGFSIVKNCMEGLFEDEIIPRPMFSSPRQDSSRVISSPRFELHRGNKKGFPLESPQSEVPKLGTTGRVISHELMEGRIEVFRIGLDLTILALQNERNRRWFEGHEGGWAGYAELFKKALSCSKETPLSEPPLDNVQLNHTVLGVLLSRALSRDESLLNLFNSNKNPPISPFPALLPISTHLDLSDPQLFAVVIDQLPLPYTSSRRTKFDKIPDKITNWPRLNDSNTLSLTTDLSQFEETLWRLILVIIQSNWLNLFKVTKTMGLGGLVECVLDRLYPPKDVPMHCPTTTRRKLPEGGLRPSGQSYDASQDPFLAVSTRPVLHNLEKGDRAYLPAAQGDLRLILMKVLKRLLEAGVHPRLSFRLFKLLRKEDGRQGGGDSRTPRSGRTTNGDVTPVGTRSPLTFQTKSKGKRSKTPALKLDLENLQINRVNGDRLDVDLLEAIDHGMGKRWPDLFGFNGRDGGLDLKGLGKWPSKDRGFYFMAWIYVEQLCAPVTLLQICGEGGRTFLRIRILPNSQVAVAVVDYSAESKEEHPQEVVFSSSEAMVPHQKWIHIAVGGRSPPSTSNNGIGPEVKLVLNGRRCGKPLKSHYPIPPKGSSLVCHIGHEVSGQEALRFPDDETYQGLDSSLWYLGQSALLSEYIGDDLALLLHHLGPRYQGNFQEPLGKFLTYEGATALNIYLSQLAKVTRQGARTTLPANSYLIKGIKQGRVISEETILYSLGAQNVVRSNSRDKDSAGARSYQVMNAAVPTLAKGLGSISTRVDLSDGVFWMRQASLDQAFNYAGGPGAGLHLVEMAMTPKELQHALSILFHTVKEDWQASEEMEKMHGYDILAGLLRNKMQDCMTVSTFQTLFLPLGINFDKPDNATILNSAAYKALALKLDLWSRANQDVLEAFCLHFEHLLITSRHKRFNILKCFKKVAIVRAFMFALKANTFDSTAVPIVIRTIKTILEVHWSAEDSIKPLFAYLVSALCPGWSDSTLELSIVPLANKDLAMQATTKNPTQSQTSAAILLQTVVQLCQQPDRLNKLQATLPVHRILMIFLSSNPAEFVVSPCFDLISTLLTSPSGGPFREKFENEGGIALLCQILPEIWNVRIQTGLFACLELRNGSTRLNAGLFPAIIGALSRCLGTAFGGESASAGRPGVMRGGSSSNVTVAFGSSPSLPSMTCDDVDTSRIQALEDLLLALNETLRSDHEFHFLFTNRYMEDLIPSIADFISLSGTSGVGMDMPVDQKKRIIDDLSTLLEHLQAIPDLPPLMRDQISALLEQIRMTVGVDLLSSSLLSSSATSIRSSKSFLSSTSFGQSRTPGRLSRRPTTGDRTSSSRRNFISRKIPIIRRLTGETNSAENKDKNIKWKQSIIAAESAKFAKTTLESKEYWRKVEQEDWPRQRVHLVTDVGLWQDRAEDTHWRLDGSEGPLRKRMKLERSFHHAPEKTALVHPRSFRTAVPRDDELSSAVSRIGLPQGEDPFAAAMGDATRRSSVGNIKEHEDDPEQNKLPMETVDDDFAEETDANDNQRRISAALQSGDTIEETYNISRVIGVDGAPGLLILGRRCLYVLDGLVKLDSGEIVASQDAPRDMFSIPSGTEADIDTDELQTHRWAYPEVVETNKRSFLFRDVAIEFFLADKRNFLCVFRNKKERQAALHKLGSKKDPNAMKQSAIGNLIMDTVAKAIDKASLELDGYTRQWQNRQISNFAYLQILNQYANRTPNDVTQYPVFPWVLRDYSSEALDLTAPNTFRDLSLPMGALTDNRRQAATERYQQSQMSGEKPFQFGTHYSSSMIACSFMIRLSPFTEMFLTLQGGNFDLADRLFSSVSKAWKSASEDNRGDVRELIPEFFYSPLFLDNINHHDFGKKQNSDEGVDAVELPVWALDDPLLFIHRHREALESDYVSRNLSAWIDLIFGCKQHDEASFTCFHPLSYKNAVDLDAISDEGERAASVGIIHNFGQTPHQIFALPHPQRFMGSGSTLPVDKRFGVDEHHVILMRSVLPIDTATVDGYGIFAGPSLDAAPAMTPHGRVVHPTIPSYSIRYGFSDQSIRGYSGASKAVCIAEQSSAVEVTFISPTRFVSASPEGVLTVWRIRNAGPSTLWSETTRLIPITTLRGHEGTVTGLFASPPWSVLVSTSEDGSAIVWDTNRFKFLRKLIVQPGEAIRSAAIDDASGHVALQCDSHIHVYTLNGALIAKAETPAGPLANYSMFGSQGNTAKFNGGISFFEQEFSRHGPLLAVGLGGDIGLWRLTPGILSEPAWSLREIKRLAGPGDSVGDVTAVKFIGDRLYASFAINPAVTQSKAAMYQWSLPEGGARNVPDTASSECMSGCGRSFGLLEPRRHCGGCGGVFCSADAVAIIGFSLRYCPGCRVVLALAVDVIGGPGSRRGSLANSNSRRSSVAQPLGLYSRRGSMIT